MKKHFGIILYLLGVILGSSSTRAWAGACEVAYPKDFNGAFERLTREGCVTKEGINHLTFKGPMEIYLDRSLSLTGSGAPILISASDGVLVQISGGNGIAPITIKRDRVTLQNLTIRGFSGAPIQIEGNDITLKQMKVMYNGEGILITDGQDSLSCESLSQQRRARNIAISESEINNNGEYGVHVQGYQVSIRNSQIHNHSKAGVFLQSDSKAYQCRKDGEIFDVIATLHTLLTSKTTFFDNGTGIETSGPVFPAPTSLIALADAQGNITVSGHIPFTKNPTDPWSLGLVSTNHIKVEIYDGLPGEAGEGRQFVGEAASITPDGNFRTVIAKQDLRAGDAHFFTAIAIDTLLNVSSTFGNQSSCTDEVGCVSGNDTDADGLVDAQEDINENGKVDVGETDPLNPDSDADGVKDGIERQKGLDPANADSDGDCVLDGVEMGVSKDQLLELRQQNKGTPQKVRLSQQCLEKAKKEYVSGPTNAIFDPEVKKPSWEEALAFYDEDPTTTSDPKNADTDDDHLKDGLEDKNWNGKLDEKEGDPISQDTDKDGLEDGDEVEQGTDLRNSDTDGDGVSDGVEIHTYKSNPKKCDTDGDGLGDGLEAGVVHPNASTSECRGLQKAGSNMHDISLMNPTAADSDHDGVDDGDEDANHNGWFDFNETDPSSPDTDGDGLNDGFEKALVKNPKDLLSRIDISHLSNGEHCSPPTSESDLDCDGVMNGRDDDSDGDGCADSDEMMKDTNNDGVPDVWDAMAKGCTLSRPSSSSGSSGSSGGGNTQPTASESPTQPGKGLDASGKIIPTAGEGSCQLNRSKETPEKGDLILFYGVVVTGVMLIGSMSGASSRKP